MRLAAFALAVCILSAIGIQDAQTMLDAKSTWTRVLAAKGGPERLHLVRGLAWSSSDSVRTSKAFGGVQYEFVELYPDRSWVWEDYRPGTLGFAVEVWNADKQLQWHARQGGRSIAVSWRRDAELARRARMREHQLLFLLETASLQPIPRSARSTATGIAIELDMDGFWSVTISIDRQTFLPTALVLVPDVGEPGSRAAGVAKEYSILRYSDIDGLKMPTRIVGLGDLTFRINPQVDLSLFETPPDSVTSRDAWMKYLKK